MSSGPRTYPAGGGIVTSVAERISRRARAERLRHFRAATGVDAATTILDVGCGSAGLLAMAPDLDVTGVDIRDQPGYPGRLIRADATERLPFSDGEFEIAYCNSVVEHVAVERREAFAAELRRVARGWYVQTPAFGFPIEPHSLLPFAHWLPLRWRRHYWRLGLGSEVDTIQLLRRRELEALFGPAVPERLGPLTKSWVAIRRPEAAR